jgi:hypothetical protein
VVVVSFVCFALAWMVFPTTTHPMGGGFLVPFWFDGNKETMASFWLLIVVFLFLFKS